jgi:hypothetical protein
LSEPPPGAHPAGPYVVGPLGPAQAPPRSRRKRVDRTVGIVLGLVLGIAVVTGFVFLGSEGTVDAPGISGVKSTKQAPAPAAQPRLPGQGR